MIVAVQEDSVAAYAKIEPGDRIRSVNETTDLDIMTGLLQSEMVVDLDLVRFPPVFSISLCKQFPGDILGIRIGKSVTPPTSGIIIPAEVPANHFSASPI